MLTYKKWFCPFFLLISFSIKSPSTPKITIQKKNVKIINEAPGPTPQTVPSHIFP